jgi:hypothetical protein
VGQRGIQAQSNPPFSQSEMDCFLPARVSARCAGYMRQHLPRGGARSGSIGTARPFPVVLCRAGSSPLSQHARMHARIAGRQASRQVGRLAMWVCVGPHACPNYPCLPFPIRCGKMRGRDWLGRGKALVLGPAFPGGGGGVGQGKWMPWVGVFELAVWSGWWLSHGSIRLMIFWADGSGRDGGCFCCFLGLGGVPRSHRWFVDFRLCLLFLRQAPQFLFERARCQVPICPRVGLDLRAASHHQLAATRQSMSGFKLVLNSSRLGAGIHPLSTSGVRLTKQRIQRHAPRPLIPSPSCQAFLSEDNVEQPTQPGAVFSQTSPLKPFHQRLYA